MARAKYHNAVAFVAVNDYSLDVEKVCQEPAVKLVAHVWEPFEVALLVIGVRRKLKSTKSI